MEEEEDEAGESKYRLYFALALGSGFGLATGKGELDPAMHQLQAAGFAPAQLGHIAPEIGYFFTGIELLS